ncbi:MAG: hypothetical protein U5J83_16730 [Bryobacterales bacterium]|nr:hypothetical protein [Bryobacterales bacterium]
MTASPPRRWLGILPIGISSSIAATSAHGRRPKLATEGHHGSDCSPAPAAHRISSWQNATYVCLDHGHTALSASGYGAIYLTPNHLVDFSAGEAVVAWSNYSFTP